MANTDIKGLADVLNMLSDSPLKMHKGLRVGLYVAAKLVESEAKSNVPVEHGSLRESIRTAIHYTDDKILATVKAGGEVVDGTYIAYAHLIEYSGAAAHDIVAHGKDLAFGGHAYPVVHHPGMKAHPFLRPALDSQEVTAVGLIDQAVDAILKSK